MEGVEDGAKWRFFVKCCERSSLSSVDRLWYSCRTSLPMLGDSEHMFVLIAGSATP